MDLFNLYFNKKSLYRVHSSGRQLFTVLAAIFTLLDATLFKLLELEVGIPTANPRWLQSCRILIRFGLSIVPVLKPLTIMSWCRYINGFCQSAPIRSKIAPEQEKIQRCYQKKSELSTPSRKISIAIWNFAICPGFLLHFAKKNKGKLYSLLKIFEKKMSGFMRKRMEFIINFKLIVLRTQKELRAQIWRADRPYAKVVSKNENLTWISLFWSYKCSKLQIDRSQSWVGVERTDFVSEHVYFQSLDQLDRKLKILCGFSLFWSFRCSILQIDRSHSEGMSNFTWLV